MPYWMRYCIEFVVKFLMPCWVKGFEDYCIKFCWMRGFEKYFGASRPEGAVPPPVGGGKWNWKWVWYWFLSVFECFWCCVVVFMVCECGWINFCKYRRGGVVVGFCNLFRCNCINFLLQGMYNYSWLLSILFVIHDLKIDFRYWTNTLVRFDLTFWSLFHTWFDELLLFHRYVLLLAF